MLLFDFDGTLVDSNGIWVEIDDAFLARRGLEPTWEYSQMMGSSIFPIAAQITRDYYRLDLTPQAIMDEWLELAGDAYARRVPMKEGAKAFLDQCARAGERMALFTACVPELCRAALARHGLAGYFQQVIYAQELGLEKRDPRAFPLVLERLHARPEESALFEDSLSGCAAAKAAGLTVVGVYDPFYAQEEARLRALCDRYIYSFSELLA